jgi:hypothetical protein
MKEIFGIARFDDINDLMNEVAKMTPAQHKHMLLDIVWKVGTKEKRVRSQPMGLLAQSFNTARYAK